jgi:hypothetical protein
MANRVWPIAYFVVSYAVYLTTGVVLLLIDRHVSIQVGALLNASPAVSLLGWGLLAAAYVAVTAGLAGAVALSDRRAW